jgi:S-layer homology domain
VSTSTINVKVKHGGTSTYVTTGLTNDENATCTAGIPSVGSNIATVFNGIATIYSCQASTFVAVATLSGGGGSSGGSSGGGPGTFTPVQATALPNNNTGTTSTPKEDTLKERLKNLASTFPLATLQLANLGFRDIRDNWARSYIEKLAVRKIIRNSYNFNPNAALTRAEYMKIIVNAFGWKLPATMADLRYNDVPRTHTLAAYIALARSEGLISATLPSFRPDAPITRAEAMKILILALGADVSDVPVSFADVDNRSDLAKYIEKAKMYEIISGQKIGTRTYFRPNDSITRAEIAKIIALALEF